MIYSLLIQIKTWTKDFSDLYNYDSLEEKSISLLVDKKGYLIRSKNNVSFVEYYGFNKYKESYERFKIAEIECIDNNFYLRTEYSTDEITYDIDNRVYILANSINGERINEDDYYGYELNEGDIIKIGRYKIKVRKIKLNKKIEKDENEEKIEEKKEKEKIEDKKETEKSENISILKEDKDKTEDKYSSNKKDKIIDIKNKVPNDSIDKQCRICFSSSEELSPLISPCSCTGSSKYIHLLCLQKWLQSKIKLEYKEVNENLISGYIYHPAQCEICKEYMPDFVKKNNNLYEICDYHSSSENNEDNYFTLETIGSIKNHEKYIFDVIIKSEQPISVISIGRYNGSDIRLEDNTISRIHSALTVENNKLYIKDMSSKFGTGILLQNNNFPFMDNKPISFQFGKSIITFCQFIKTNNICKCLNKNSDRIEDNNKDSDFYINENKIFIKYENGYNIKENN